jgi:acyl-CoA reductase-like NAD-dependent aldehyde dehydrogenase
VLNWWGGERLNRDTRAIIVVALFVGSNNKMRINREEVWPVASVIKVGSYDEAWR